MNIALILAGGSGTRMKLSYPKQFAEINGMPMVAYSLKAFEKNEKTDEIYVVCSEEWQEKMISIVRKYRITKFKGCIEGGPTRRHSSLNAVRYIYGKADVNSVLMIHDAARPGLTDRIINDNIEECLKTGACCTAVDCRDTMCRKKDGFMGDTIRREDAVLLQTPQTFNLGLIYKAHQNYEEKLLQNVKVPDITDDTGLVKFLDHNISLVNGSISNMKVTDPGDLDFFAGKISENI